MEKRIIMLTNETLQAALKKRGDDKGFQENTGITKDIAIKLIDDWQNTWSETATKSGAIDVAMEDYSKAELAALLTIITDHWLTSSQGKVQHE